MASSINLGDKTIFEEVYRLYYPPLCFFAAKYVGRDEGEDIVESVFLRLWKQKKEFSSTSHTQAFLYQSVKNSCLDFIKIQGRKDRRYEIIAERLTSIENDYLHDMIRAEVVAEVYRAINNLPLQCSKIVYMGYVEGLNNEEIAKELSLSVQTVKNHKVRALKILKKQFTGNNIAFVIISQIIF